MPKEISKPFGKNYAVIKDPKRFDAMFRAGDKVFRQRRNKNAGGAGSKDKTANLPFVTATDLFVCYSRPLARHKNHLGIVTSKKVGSAVCRNRARRLIREAWRLTANEKFGGGRTGVCYETVIVVRAADWKNIKTEQVAAVLDKFLFSRICKL